MPIALNPTLLDQIDHLSTPPIVAPRRVRMIGDGQRYAVAVSWESPDTRIYVVDTLDAGNIAVAQTLTVSGFGPISNADLNDGVLALVSNASDAVCAIDVSDPLAIALIGVTVDATNLADTILSCVVVDSTTIYTSSAQTLGVWSLGGGAPALASTLSLAPNNDVTLSRVSADLCIAAGQGLTDNFTLIDSSVPTSPSVGATTTPSGSILRSYYAPITDSIVIGMSGASGGTVHVIDISGTPTVLSSYSPTGGSLTEDYPVIVGDLCMIATGGAISVADLTDVAAIAEHDVIDFGAYTSVTYRHAYVILGVYFAATNGYMQSIGLTSDPPDAANSGWTDPRSPIGAGPNGWNPDGGVSACCDFDFIAGVSSTLLDTITSADLPTTNMVLVQGSHAFMACPDSGTQDSGHVVVVDISDPANLAFEPDYEYLDANQRSPRVGCISPDGTRLVVGVVGPLAGVNAEAWLDTFDISNPAAIALDNTVGPFAGVNFGRGAVRVGNYMLVEYDDTIDGSDDGIAVYDISTATPTLSTIYTALGSLFLIGHDEDRQRLYGWDGATVRILDVSTPTSISSLGSFTAAGIGLTGGTTPLSGIKQLSMRFTDGGTIARFSDGGSPYGNGSSKLVVLDVTDAASVSKIGEVIVPFIPTGYMEHRDGYSFVVQEAGVRVYFDDGTGNPTEADTGFGIGATGWATARVDNHMFVVGVTEDFHSVEMLDVATASSDCGDSTLPSGSQSDVKAVIGNGIKKIALALSADVSTSGTVGSTTGAPYYDDIAAADANSVTLTRAASLEVSATIPSFLMTNGAYGGKWAMFLEHYGQAANHNDDVVTHQAQGLYNGATQATVSVPVNAPLALRTSTTPTFQSYSFLSDVVTALRARLVTTESTSMGADGVTFTTDRLTPYILQGVGRCTRVAGTAPSTHPDLDYSLATVEGDGTYVDMARVTSTEYLSFQLAAFAPEALSAAAFVLVTTARSTGAHTSLAARILTKDKIVAAANVTGAHQTVITTVPSEFCRQRTTFAWVNPNLTAEDLAKCYVEYTWTATSGAIQFDFVGAGSIFSSEGASCYSGARVVAFMAETTDGGKLDGAGGSWEVNDDFMAFQNLTGLVMIDRRDLLAWPGQSGTGVYFGPPVHQTLGGPLTDVPIPGAGSSVLLRTAAGVFVRDGVLALPVSSSGEVALAYFDVSDPTAVTYLGIGAITGRSGTDLAQCWYWDIFPNPTWGEARSFAIVGYAEASVLAIQADGPGATAELGEWTPDVGDTFLNARPLTTLPGGLVVIGGLRGLSGSTPKLVVADFSNPAAPTTLAEVTSPAASAGYGFAVVMPGATRMVASRASWLDLWDVSNPAAPVLIQSFASGTPNSAPISRMGDNPSFFWLVNTELQVVELTADDQLVFAGTSDYHELIAGLNGAGAILYASRGPANRVQAVSADACGIDPNALTLLGWTANANISTGQRLRNGPDDTVFAYSSSNDFLHWFDCATSTPVFLDQEDVSLLAPSMYAPIYDPASSYVMGLKAIAPPNELYLWDVSTPPNFGAAVTVALTGFDGVLLSARAAGIVGTHLVCMFGSEIGIVDISTPTSATAVHASTGTFFTGGLTSATEVIALSSTRCLCMGYNASGNPRVFIVDISTPTAPYIVGEYIDTTSTNAMNRTQALFGTTLAYVTGGSTQADVVLVDVSDHANPHQVDRKTFVNMGGATAVVQTGGLLFVAVFTDNGVHPVGVVGLVSYPLYTNANMLGVEDIQVLPGGERLVGITGQNSRIGVYG